MKELSKERPLNAGFGYRWLCRVPIGVATTVAVLLCGCGSPSLVRPEARAALAG